MDTPVSCPVCTLYLREGVSLQNHLNTHPKDQVIEALLKFCSSVRDSSAQSDVENVVDGQYLNQQNEQSVTESSVPSISNQQQYPCSSSHFTAAVTYQQFMSSNASVGGTVLPQCFSVPAIITTPAGEPGQATLMPLLYNPYVIQQQQQQLQFYNALRTLPQQPLSRQIVSPSPLFPISPQFSVAASGNPIYQTTLSSNSALQSGDNGQSNSTIFVPPVNSDNEDNLKCSENDNNETNEDVTKCKEIIKHSPKKAIQSSQNQEVGSETEVVISKSNECNSPILPIVYEDMNDVGNLPVITDSKDDPCTSIVYENICEGKTVSCSKPDCEESCSSENDARSNVGDTISNPISPGLRVRADLGRISPNSRDSFVDDRNSNSGGMCGGNDIQDDNGGTSLSNDKSVEDEGWEFLSEKEKENTDVDSVEHDGRETSEYITSDLYPSQMEPVNPDQPTEQTCEEQGSEMTARHFKVVDIEGMQVLVASHIVSTEENNSRVNAELPVRTPSEHFSSGDNPTDCDEVNAAANPDIQTDEVMPAMGELSGQESIGENDTNSWSQEKDDITTSYDLLAREKWEVSDGSDEENDGDINESMAPEDCDVRPAEVTPLPTASSVEEQYIQEKTNKKEKPKCFYKCWICNQIFTCPKERRVHQSEKHAARTIGTKVENLKSSTWSIIKNEENQPVEDTMKHLSEESDDKVCVKSEIELLPSIPEEINENKIPVEGKSKTFDEECVNELKSIEEPSKPEEDAFKFICSRCEGVFASAKSLHRHVRTAHGQSQFTCRTCGEKYPSEATYLAHLKIHPLECSRCGKYFYRHQNLNLHIRRHLGIKPFKCTICDKAFVTKQKLAEHTNTHTGDTPIKCNLCTETFRRYSNLIQHKNRHHLKIKKKVKDFICHCGEVFHSQKKLHWHKEIHDEKPKTCSYCSERFVHASSLTRHIRKAHDQRYFPCQGRESENVECPICGCIFLKSSLPVHMRLHSGERPFNCHICGKNFSTKWNLQLHRWTHASRSLKPYKCSLCKSAFIRHSEYTSHMHSHRNVRPYTCNYCGSQFIRKYNCIRHAREHESEKPFTCNICQKSFHRRYYLKEHMRIHSGLRPFTCHICGKTSSTKSNHNKHVKIHHAREAVNTEG